MKKDPDIESTFNRVAKVIADEKPDIILLQEIDDGSKRTDYEVQIERLMQMLPPRLCLTSWLLLQTVHGETIAGLIFTNIYNKHTE